MSWAAEEAQLRAILAEVDGVATVLQGEPTDAAHAFPLAYVRFLSYQRTPRGQVMQYRAAVYVCIAINDQSISNAEAALAPFVNSIPAALDAQPTLNNTAIFAQVLDGSSGYIDLPGGVTVLFVRHQLEITDTDPKAR